MQVFRILNAVSFTALTAVTFQLWRQRRDEATRWITATIGVLAAVSVIGLLLPDTNERIDGGAYLWFVKVVLVALFLYPYALYRFMAAFGDGTKALDRLAVGATAAVAVATFALPYIPDPQDDRPTWMVAYVLLIVAQWSSLSTITAARLWRAGRGQPSVARRRMRLLAFGAAFLTIAILPSIGGPADEQSIAVQAIARISPLVAAFLFFLGFSPPAWLRVLWRRQEESQLREVEAGLMSATTVTEVADALLPRIAQVSGSRGSLLLDSAGAQIAAFNVSDADAGQVTDAVLAGASPIRVVSVGRDVLAIPLRRGWLAVQLSPYTPLFGGEEVRLLEALGLFVDLALERVTLFEREREARQEIERATAELETLVYGVSHDLKSPIITLLGYLEYLTLDFGELLPAEGHHYLDRMKASALYMQELIQDLLELSRIGRVQTEAEDVELAPLVSSIADELRAAHPTVEVAVGDLPVVRLNPVRARQLFTNLLDNSAKHGGRPDIAIRVESHPGREGSAVVTVEDDGHGIPLQYRERVFGIFERLEGPTDRTGTGMGLAICRKIVEEVGGQIAIVDADRGTKIEIHLTPAVATAGHRQLETQR